MGFVYAYMCMSENVCGCVRACTVYLCVRSTQRIYVLVCGFACVRVHVYIFLCMYVHSCVRVFVCGVVACCGFCNRYPHKHEYTRMHADAYSNKVYIHVYTDTCVKYTYASTYLSVFLIHTTHAINKNIHASTYM